jgi:hypothetical protein
MVRNDTGIAVPKQGHFPAAFAEPAPDRQPEARRRETPKQRQTALSGQEPDNTIHVNENTNHAVSRGIASEWFWDP